MTFNVCLLGSWERLYSRLGLNIYHKEKYRRPTKYTEYLSGQNHIKNHEQRRKGEKGRKFTGRSRIKCGGPRQTHHVHTLLYCTVLLCPCPNLPDGAARTFDSGNEASTKTTTSQDTSLQQQQQQHPLSQTLPSRDSTPRSSGDVASHALIHLSLHLVVPRLRL